MPRVSVIICGYTHRRWDLLERAVKSVLAQSAPPEELLVVADHDDRLLELARAAFPQVGVVASTERPGLAGARNTGVRHSTGDVVAFMDDDARAAPDWLARIADAFENPLVIGVGGSVEPDWADAPPDWLPAEFHWVVGCSYRGLPGASAPIRNPIGANMAFRRDAVERAGGFTDGIGRVSAVPLGCEETELAIRLRRRDPSAVVLYLPDARVCHRVPKERTTWGYYRARCWSEGLSKALVTRAVGVSDGLASERSYATRTLREGILRGLRDALRGDRSGLLRAGAIVAGLAITTAGYVRGRVNPAQPTTGVRRRRIREHAGPLVGLVRLAPSAGAALRNAAIVLTMPLLRPLLQRARRTLPVRIAADGREHVFQVDCMGDLKVLYEVWGWRQYDLPALAGATTIVDAGANIGASVAFFKSQQPAAVIHAYEPDPATFVKLECNVRGLSGVVLHAQAITAHDGVARLYASPDSWDSSLLGGPGGAVTVPCRRLMTALREAGLERVDLLKLDIEGAEFEVLADDGALQAIEALVCELHFDFVADSELQDVLEACAGFGVAVSGDPETRMTLVGRREGGGRP